MSSDPYLPLGDNPLDTITKEASRFGLRVNSNRRTPAEQQALIKQGRATSMSSNHLTGNALDLDGDPKSLRDFTEYMRDLYGRTLKSFSMIPLEATSGAGTSGR